MRSTKRRTGLRSRLALLVLAALLPALVIEARTVLAGREDVLTHAETDARRLSIAAAGEAQALVAGTSRLLVALGEQALIAEGEPALCERALVGAHKRLPEYASMSMAKPTGEVFASSPPTTTPISQADIRGFQRALAERRLVVEEARMGRAAGRFVIPMRYPVTDDDGVVRAVVTAAFDLRRLDDAFASITLPMDGSIALLEGDGRLIARYPEPEKWVGSDTAGAFGFDLAEVSGDTAYGVGLDSVERLYAVTPVALIEGAAPLYVAVGLPTTMIEAERDAIARRGLFQLALIGALALAAVWLGAELLVARPVARLVDVTRRFGTGERSARADAESGAREMRALGVSFNAMADTLEARERELAATAEELERYFTLNLDLLCIADLDGRLLRLNPEWENVLGYPIAEIVGRLILDFVHPDDAESTREALGALSDGTSVGGFINRWRRVDGSYRVIEWRATPFASGGRVYAAARDITERVEAERALREHKEHLEELVAHRTEALQLSNEELASVNEELEAGNEELAAVNQEMQAMYRELAAKTDELARANEDISRADAAKSDFLASMSHELRTPLNSVIGFSDILAQGMAGPLTDEQLRQLAMINSSGRHLLELINDVLDLSKIEAGRLDTHPERFIVSEEIDPLVETMRVQALDKGLELRVEYPADSLEIISDRRMIRQVLLNLLGNAIKFTENGSVALSVSCDPDGAVAFAVADTGPGIPAEELERVFDAFTQVVLPARIKPGGTGLGLTISARLAALLGGTLEAESEPDHGSTFTLRVPRCLSDGA